LSAESIWRQRLWVWLPALLFFLANAGGCSVYQLGYAGRVESLERAIEEQEKALEQASAERAARQALVDRARLARQRLAGLYDQRFSTRARRLTEITAEVKDLARKAGMVPRSISYPEQAIEDFGLIKRSFVFSVEGGYVELRQFINLLELSPSFLTLEQVTLAESQGERLNIQLRLSTLFAKEPVEGALPVGGGRS
jgi:Tfp pilus assembly protein PilO